MLILAWVGILAYVLECAVFTILIIYIYTPVCSGVWSVGFAAQWLKALFYRFCQSCPSRDGERYRGQKRTLASTDVIEVLHHSAPTFEYAMLNIANWHQTSMISHLKLQRWMQHIYVSCNQLKHVLNVSAQRNLSKPWNSWWEIGHTTRRSWGVHTTSTMLELPSRILAQYIQ